MGFFSRLLKSKQNKNEFQENHDLPDLPNLPNIPNGNKKSNISSAKDKRLLLTEMLYSLNQMKSD